MYCQGLKSWSRAQMSETAKFTWRKNLNLPGPAKMHTLNLSGQLISLICATVLLFCAQQDFLSLT